MQLRAGSIALVVLAASVSACGGGSTGSGSSKSVSAVRSCLKGISSLTLSNANKSDEQVTDAVVGEYASSTDQNNILMGAAAQLKDTKDSGKFIAQMKTAAKQIGSKAYFQSGVDGKYIWITLAGSKNVKNLDRVQACVKP